MIYKTIYLTQKYTVVIFADGANQIGFISKLDEGTFRAK